jgi:hypothetical protein
MTTSVFRFPIKFVLFWTEKIGRFCCFHGVNLTIFAIFWKISQYFILIKIKISDGNHSSDQDRNI